MIYNVIFTYKEVKDIDEYLNLSQENFFKKLWDYTYEDNLWDFIDENNPSKEELIDFIDNIFIDDDVLHGYYEDERNCIAFTVENNRISLYYWNQALEDFIMDRVLEEYTYSEITGQYIRKPY